MAYSDESHCRTAARKNGDDAWGGFGLLLGGIGLAFGVGGVVVARAARTPPPAVALSLASRAVSFAFAF